MVYENGWGAIHAVCHHPPALAPQPPCRAISQHDTDTLQSTFFFLADDRRQAPEIPHLFSFADGVCATLWRTQREEPQQKTVMVCARHCPALHPCCARVCAVQKYQAEVQAAFTASLSKAAPTWPSKVRSRRLQDTLQPGPSPHCQGGAADVMVMEQSRIVR